MHKVAPWWPNSIKSFQDLGVDQIPQQLNNDLPPQVKGLEAFVCQVYSSSGLTAIPALRWELFRSKNLEREMLPPTRAALLPHLMTANYTAMRDKIYPIRCPNLPPVEQNGWKWRIACSFLSDVLIILHQGLLSSASNVDVNQTAMKPDVVALKCSALHLLCKCYKGVRDNQTRDEQRLVISWRLVMI